LKDNKAHVAKLIQEAVNNVTGSGTEDLPINDAALRVSCIVEYLPRATDEKGQKLPGIYRVNATVVTVGVGFITL